MKKFSRQLIDRFSSEDALLVYSSLRPLFQGRAQAFFRTSEAIEGGFRPHLSILAFEAETIMQSKDGVIRTLQNGQMLETVGSPLEWLQQRLSEERSDLDIDYPYFQGGALGYFGYDLVRHLEPILLSSKNLRMQTGKFDSEVVFFQHYLVFDHTADRVLAYSRDSANGAQFLKTVNELKLIARPPVKSQSVELAVTSMKSAFGKEPFMAAVSVLQEHIKEGNIFQAVLSEKFSHPFSGDPFSLFVNLTEVNQAPYHFYFQIDDRSYLGASPEMLLKADQALIETHPIAGTRPRGKNQADELKQEQILLSSPKEKAEHLMLVDLARNDIGRVAMPGTVKVESFMKLRKFGGVMHLVSRVNGKKPEAMSSLTAFASCFPAGTLSGAPKIKAMQLISELETAPRGFYGGAFFAASVTGDLDSCIAIRSLEVSNHQVSIQAGAGIVADSSPEEEYDEICHKSRLARTALAITLAEERS